MQRLKNINKTLEGKAIVLFEDIDGGFKHSSITKDTLLRVKIVFMSFKDVLVYSIHGIQITPSLSFESIKDSTRLVYKNELKINKRRLKCI